MKWIIGGLLLAVVASVASGRVPLGWIVYCFAALFASMGLALFFAFYRSRHYGLLLLGCTYVSAALLAVVLTDWWPLVGGFAVAWVLRAMGVEPPAEPAAPEAMQAAPSAPADEKKS